MLRLDPHWFDNGRAFWYFRDASGGTGEYIRVDSATGKKTPLFDAKRLAAALAKELGQDVDPDRLPLRTVEFDGKIARFVAGNQSWMIDLGSYGLTKMKSEPPTSPRARGPRGNRRDSRRDAIPSPDGKWTARIVDNAIIVADSVGGSRTLTPNVPQDGFYSRLVWSRDSRRLIAVKTHPGDHKQVYLIQNSPPEWGPAKLTQRTYDRPGDKVDTYDIQVFDPAGQVPPTEAEAIDYGDYPAFRPTTDGAFTYQKMDRGYGRFRVLRLEPISGKTSAVFDDDPSTFVDSTALVTEYLKGSDEIIVSSERDGWHHLYLADGKGGLRQITKGNWVVRGVEKVDEEHRQIIFRASGINAGEDPYCIHYYRINFDGSNMVGLTPAKGNHRAVFGPDGTVLVDTYSTVEQPPIHELRSGISGKLISTLEKGDISRLLAMGWRPPQPFVAKGRDGKTDIYGVVFRPTNFDPKKRYPVVEDIYAGPQDSFVPKSFSPAFYQQRVAELGFIVVQIDGMGTRNRSKAFHDVCYKNLADAGFEDRILWMKALGKVEPSADLERVGIYGTSAGGQNAGAAVLFHPEFYKVAVASCGCHDNRLDKIWWNEQWMGLMGSHYATCSNIENASKLQGDLLLIVGELDTNVPPESTYRFAAALQTAGKEFELVVIPNSDHTAGGPYGERKRRDFLVRHLLRVEPPNPNS